MQAQVLKRQGWNRSAGASVMLVITLALAILSPGISMRSGELVAALRQSARPAPATGAQEAAATSAQAQSMMESLPLSFIPNVGSTDPQASFVLQDSGTLVWFTPRGLTMSLPQADRSERWVLKLDFVGAAPVTPVVTGPAGASINYFTGPQAEWKTNVASSSSITYPELWPGIDLIYSGAQGSLKYDFVVKPGADPSQIQLAYRGAAGVSLGRAGDLQVKTPHAGLSDQRPFSYQTVNGRQVEVASSYRLSSPTPASHPYGFNLGAYDPTLPLVIDPVMVLYAGYFGGTETDQATDIAVDSAGAAYITGETASPASSFPETVGPDLTYGGGVSDAFVAKIKPDGSALEYASYIGGTGFDFGSAITVDAAGATYVVGDSDSPSATFPVAGTLDPTNNGGSDAFVAKIKPDGSDIEFAGYVGGAGDDRAWGIALDTSNNVLISGQTASDQNTFPVLVGPDLTFNGGILDAFVAKIKPDGSALEYAGYLGGDGIDAAFDVVVDPSGAAFLVGNTYSGQATFPEVGGPDLTYNQGGDAFLAKVAPTGASLSYAGYLGGDGFDLAYRVALDATGAAYLTGRSGSGEATFPLAIGPDITANGNGDAFVTKVNPAGTGVVYSGYIGGAAFDQGLGIAVDSTGAAYIGGQTASNQFTFPLTNGPDSTYNGGDYDGFVTKVNPDGAGLEYSGYVGGSALYDRVSGIALGPDGAALISGLTSTPDFPIAGSLDTTPNGGLDGFVAKIGQDKADVSVAKSCTSNPVAPGGILSCTITVTNAGPGVATNLKVTEDQNLAPGVVLTTAPAGGGAICTVQVANPEVTCTKAAQPVDSFTITYAVQLSPDAVPGSSFSHTTTVSSDALDVTPANNSVTKSTQIPACTITGTAVAETLNGTAGPDVICGLGGSDKLLGRGGDDILIGGAGADTVKGAAGNDSLIGGSEDDQLYGGRGNDRIFGGAGNDLMLGDADQDTLVGGDGNDNATGGPGTDACSGEQLNTCETGVPGN